MGLLCSETKFSRRKKGAGLVCAIYIFLVGLFWSSPRLQAQRVDSVLLGKGLAFYRAAVKDYESQDWQATVRKTEEAVRLFLLAGDTIKACTALELQANATQDDGKGALATLARAIRLYEQGPGDTSFVYFRLQLTRMHTLRNMERFPDCLDQADLIDGLVSRVVQVDSSQGSEAVFNFMLLRAKINRDIGNLGQGISGIEEAQEFAKIHPTAIRKRYLADAHSMLSQLFRRSGNLPLAMEHHDDACDLLKQISNPNATITNFLLSYQMDRATLLMDGKMYDEAKQLLRRIQEEVGVQGVTNELIEAGIPANLGNIYLREDKLDSAWVFITLAKQQFEKGGPPGTLVAKMDINLAAISNKRQDHPAALVHALAAAARLTRKDFSSMEDRSKAWLEAAKAYLGMGLRDSAEICLHRLQAAQWDAEQLSTTRCPGAWQSAAHGYDLLAHFDSAEVCLRRALQACFNQQLYRGDPARIPFDQLLVESQYLQVLKTMGRVKEKRHQLTGCAADLGDAFRHYFRAAQLIAHLDAQRQHLGKLGLQYERLWRDNIGILEGAIRTALALYRGSGRQLFQHIALAISDMGKSRQIAKRSIASDAELATLIDSTTLARERALARLLETDRRIAASAASPGDTAALAARRRVEANSQQWQTLMGVLRDSFPAYYARKYQDQAHWGRVLQASFAKAPAGQARLEYFVGLDSVYAFLQTEDGLQVATLGRAKALEAKARDYQQAILHKAPVNGAFVALGKSLSRALMPFTLPRTAVRQLTIVPDGFLWELRFASLVWHGELPGSAFAHTVPYWVHGPATTTGFSFALQQAAEVQAKEAAAAVSMEGFFPEIQYPNLALLHANPAIEALRPSLKVNSHLKQDATSAHLLAALSHPGIVEIKTHGLLDNDAVSDPYLLMADSLGQVARLYASELYAVRDLLPALVVLNACVTAKGDYLPGEGAITLARGFAMAGCRSLLANGWDASEAANDATLEQFYAGLAEGRSGAEALRAARVTALTGEEGQLRHPHYWACLEYYGAGDQPLIVPDSSPWPYVLAALALAALTWLAIRRRRSHTA